MRKILGVFDPPKGHWVGDGFPVRSIFTPSSHGDQLSPFLLFDYAGPRHFEATDKRRGVGEHPHRGFETVTIVYEGEVEHRDNTGAGGKIGPGDVQWMTAAAGILHQEYHSPEFAKAGGNFELVQLWVNLPAKDKMAPPGYQTLLNGDIPSVSLPGDGGQVRVIAGEFQGHKGPAKTFTPMNIWDVRLAPGGIVSPTLPEGHTFGLVVLSGTIEVNGAEIARAAQLVLFEPTGGEVSIEANNDVKLLILSGEPLNEPVVAQGPFVMNTVGEIKQAMLDFETGKFGAIEA